MGNVDPFAAFGGHVDTTAQIKDPFAAFGGRTTGAAIEPSTTDPFAAYGGRATVAKPDNSDQPWYSRTWDWLNHPLVDLKRNGATGVEAGAEDFASGFTSPLSIGLTVATLGAAPLLENIGLNVGRLAAPELLSAAKTAGKLAAVGFTGLQLKGIADQSPSFVQAVKNGDTDKALEIGTQMVLSGAVAGLAVKHGISDWANEKLGQSPEQLKFTEKDQVVGRYQRMLKEDNEQALTFNESFKKAVPDVGAREAIQLYAEAGGDKTTLADWHSQISGASKDQVAPALKQQVSAALKRAQNLTPEEASQAQKLRDLYDPDFDEAAGHGILSTESRKTNYVARARWENEPEETELSRARTALGEATQPDHTQRRVYETTVDGILNGEEPVKAGKRYVLDAADVAADYHRAIGKEVARKAFVNNAMEAHGQDMRPLAVRGGTGQELESGTTITNSLAVSDKRLTGEEVGVLSQGERLQGLIDDGKIIDNGEGKYRWNTDGYVNDIRSPHANGYAYGGSPDVLVKAPVAFHPEIEDQARAILAPERSALRDIPGVETALKVGAAAKHTLLGGSAFHWVQEGLRGLESGVNPFRLEQWDLTNPDHVRLIEAGGLQPGIEQGANAFTEGVKGSGLLSKVPGVGKVVDRLNENLFGPSGFIDRLKLTTALKFADRLKDADPEMNQMTRYKVAGQMANARFGGLNYLAMGRSKEFQDVLRLTLLAPDWIESQVRDTAFATMFPRIGVVDLARIATYNFVAAQTLNLMVSGKMHLETPFGVQSPDGNKVYSVRTMPEDIWHAVTDPRGFAFNRLNPIITRTGMEALTGRDKMGRERTMAEQLKDLFSNIVPIPAQGVVDRMTGNEKPGTSLADSAFSAAGMTTRANLSPAEQLALRISSERAGTGPVPSEQLERHHLIINLEERLRSGDNSAINDVQQGFNTGQLAPDDVKKVLADAKVSRLESVVKHLPLSNALEIWDLATNQERAQLAPILVKKMAIYHKTEQHKLTSAERSHMDSRMAKMAAEVARQVS